MELRPYQRECIETIQSQPPGRYLVQMATGLGKTVVFSNIPRQGRVLLLSHREELVTQPRKYYSCSFGIEQAGNRSNGEEVVSASVQSIVRRLNRFSRDDFDMIIVDECFPAGTLVDGKPIQDIKIGDTVTAYNHETGKLEQRLVTHVFKRKSPRELIKINGFLVCTPNHPIFIEDERKYVYAKDIKPGNSLLHMVRETGAVEKPYETPKIQLSENWKSVLLGRVQKPFCKVNICDNHGKNKPEIRFGTNETKQSDEPQGIERKNVEHSKIDESQAENSRREWERTYKTATNIKAKNFKHFYNISSMHGICCKDGDKTKQQPNALPNELQDRYCNPRIQNRGRSRREFSFSDRKAESGQEENGILRIVRVESVEVLECGGYGEAGRLCEDGYVYNLEVDGLNNYFANGILVHNCHHAQANTYRTILNHFSPRLLLGFSATPNRSDGKGLDKVFQRIIFERDIRFGISNGYLSDIFCRRVDIGYDLSNVKTQNGDYAPGELAEAMDGTADAIAQAYHDMAEGQTIIFAASVKHAEEIAKRIPGAVVVTGKTKNRAEIIEAFTRREIPCIVNCMVFTEGTDIPLIETVIIARPTQSESLYCQMVGRGLRLYPGKDRLNLIDCVGVSGKKSLCTAPSLLGIEENELSDNAKKRVDGVMLFEMPGIVEEESDTPKMWIKNVEIVDLWSKKNDIDTHGVNWFKAPNGSFVCSLPDRQSITIPCPDKLGFVRMKDGGRMQTQEAFDYAFKWLQVKAGDCRPIWDLNSAKKWGSKPATESQMRMIQRKIKDNLGDLTRMQAGQIITRMKWKG